MTLPVSLAFILVSRQQRSKFFKTVDIDVGLLIVASPTSLISMVQTRAPNNVGQEQLPGCPKICVTHAKNSIFFSISYSFKTAVIHYRMVFID